MGSGTASSSGTPHASFIQPFVDDPRSTADSGVYPDGSGGAVPHACAAFHTGILVRYACPIVGKVEHLVRTDFHAHAAPGASLALQFKCRHVSQIPESFHDLSPYHLSISSP
jgi:hypothetical protein